MVLGACGGGAVADDIDELQALLRDDPLTGPAAAAPGQTASALDQPPFPLPERMWNFDDCSPDRAELFNSGASALEIAYRSLGVSCVPGMVGGAVALAAPGDIVYVPDEPYFSFAGGVTVAGWFRPAGIDRTQTLFRKRGTGTSAFALMLHRGRFRFVIDLGDGRAASVIAPELARVGVFQHVAATYDDAALRLYVDGQQVAVRSVAGTIPPGGGPLLIGNDGSERRFDGTIDEAVFLLSALPGPSVGQLTCFPEKPTVVVAPKHSAPTPPDVAATFDVAITNNNPAVCLPVVFDWGVLEIPVGLIMDPFSGNVLTPPVPSGATTHFAISATPFDTVDGTSIELPFSVFPLDLSFVVNDALEIAVSDPAGCHVSKSRELLINQASVIGDALRTAPVGPAGDPRVGAWSFKHLVEESAPTPADAPAMVEDMVRSFLTPQDINGFTVGPRPGFQLLLDAWPRSADGSLDLDHAPVRLKAIVNRIDLRDLDHGNAGEGSFIFAFLDGPSEIQATLIFEYKLPATSEADVMAWAQAFHALGAIPFSEQYNSTLQAITDRFVHRGARADGVNGSALHAVRSNEVTFGEGHGQFREFALSPVTGRLTPTALDRSPDQSLDASSTLSDFIASNRDSILAGTHTVPDTFEGRPFRAGAVLAGDDEIWSPFNVDSATRSAFAISTCNGCHWSETGTFYEHVSVSDTGTAALSLFLRGGTLPDPVTGEPRTFNDLRRRREDLEAIVCPAEPTTSLRHGIGRVH
jgi:hypothetical protein